jgi:hypothetical protein
MALAAISGAEGRTFNSISKDKLLEHRGAEERNFLGPELPRLVDWYFDYRPSEGFALLPSKHGDGQSGLHIINADIVSVFNTFPVSSNKDYVLRLKANWKIGLDNRAHVHVAWLDRNGEPLESSIPLRFPIGNSGEALNIYLPLTAPGNAYDIRVRIVVSRQYSGDFLDLIEIDFGMLE